MFYLHLDTCTAELRTITSKHFVPANNIYREESNCFHFFKAFVRYYGFTWGRLGWMWGFGTRRLFEGWNGWGDARMVGVGFYRTGGRHSLIGQRHETQYSKNPVKHDQKPPFSRSRDGLIRAHLVAIEPAPVNYHPRHRAAVSSILIPVSLTGELQNKTKWRNRRVLLILINIIKWWKLIISIHQRDLASASRTTKRQWASIFFHPFDGHLIFFFSWNIWSYYRAGAYK